MSARSRGVAVAVTAIVTFAATLAWRVLTFPGFQNDHYVHLARAQQLLFGDLPIRDFVDPGMPLMYLVSVRFAADVSIFPVPGKDGLDDRYAIM